MRRAHRINPHHQTQRSGLRLLGGVLVVVGGIFTAIGLISFFSAFGGGGFPSLFWCAFVGLPLLGFGTMLLKMGYMGSIARYVAGEAAPVAGDTLNYLADETQGSVRKMSAAVAAGLRGDADATATARCGSCGHDNDHDARFCDQCGSALQVANTCGQCGKVNDDDARFCDGCGTALG